MNSQLSKPSVGDDRDWVGCVVIENDKRNPEPAMKKIVAVEDGYALCGAGRHGQGRKTKVRIDRLYTGRYSLYAQDFR